MKPLSCAEVRELAAELALDALDGDERSAVLAHLDNCAGCREAVDDLSRTADVLLAALPTRDVPATLSARLHAAVPRRVDAAPQHPHHTTTDASPWRHAWLAAAAALVVVVAGVVFAFRSAEAPPGGLGEFTLESPDGDAIGEVQIRGGDRPWISMKVDHGEGTATFTCVVSLDDESTVIVGVLSISNGKGSWGGPLGPDPGDLTSAELLDTDGTVVATAQIE